MKKKIDDVVVYPEEEWSFNFDPGEFKESMKRLREELKDMKIKVNFDSDEFERDMQEFAEDIAEMEIDIPAIDLSALENLDDIKINLDDLNINLDELRERVEKFKDFMREFKSEIVADGLLDKYDEINNLDFEDGDVYLNYEKVPGHLAEKYIELYKKHFGKYPENNSFSIN